jgi:hypothetical protein
MGISSLVVFQMLRKQKKLMMPAAALLPSLLLARNPVPRELGLLTTQKTAVCTSGMLSFTSLFYPFVF